MPELKQDHNQKKQNARLGRGLGSLLSPQSFDIAEPTEPVPTTLLKEASQQNSSEGAVTSARPPSTAAPSGMKDENRVWQIDISKILPHKDQPRKEFTQTHLQELADSIKQQGIIQPITVRRLNSDSYEIVAGERRWRAAQLAGLHEVPVLIKDYDKQASLEVALIENIQRQDLNPMEEAEAYQHLMKSYNFTQQQVAEKVGKDRATVANFLRLLGLAPEVREYLKNGQISMGHAKALLTVLDPQQQKLLAKKIINLRLSVRAAEKLALQTKTQSEANKEDDLLNTDISHHLAGRSAQELQRLLGRKVQIEYKKGRGKVQIHFYSDEELSDIIERIKESWKKHS